MQLTPIKVRGKRGKAPSSKVPIKQPAQKRTSRLSSRLTTKRKSLLERQLPLEIIERIFVLSENLNFPRCSPLVGRLLSGRSTLVNLLIAAFHPTWDCWFGVDRRVLKTVLKRGATEDSPRVRRHESFPEFFPGDPEFQSSVLASPWIDVDIICDARQVWAWRFARDRWYSHSHVGPKEEETGQYNSFELTHDRVGGFGHFDSRGCFNYDWLAYGLKGSKPTLDFYVDVHPKTTVPDGLITDFSFGFVEVAQRFSLNIRPGRQVDWTVEATWRQTLRIGLQNAVTHRNPGNLDGRLIHMLLLLDDFFPSQGLEDNLSLWPLEVLEEEHAKVVGLLAARKRSKAGSLSELVQLEKRMIDYHRREVDLLTSRLSRNERLTPHSVLAVGLLPRPRNH
ncbi:actin cortical patch protein [Colletotrichum incanum]|uniref:Actin cortical patch protein n=1 Tax=Colletotrichum incanum TaxID=1573173 RepID=A0A162NW97_COLIC|nr:actin cortical patch protein [Colletotrichum incanum]